MFAILPTMLACGGSHNNPPLQPDPVKTHCRTYAATLTTTATTAAGNSKFVSTESDSCQFERATRVLRCIATVTGGGCTSIMRSATYATVADFVEEAEAVGRERWDTLEIVQSGGCSESTARYVYTYDAQKRPVQQQLNNAGFQIDTTFTAWDAQGRPTQDTWTSTSGCGSGTETRSYDDAARKVMETSKGCSATQGDQTLTYDANGNLVSQLWTGGDSSYSRESTITGSASVCLP